LGVRHCPGGRPPQTPTVRSVADPAWSPLVARLSPSASVRPLGFAFGPCSLAFGFGSSCPPLSGSRLRFSVSSALALGPWGFSVRVLGSWGSGLAAGSRTSFFWGLVPLALALGWLASIFFLGDVLLGVALLLFEALVVWTCCDRSLSGVAPFVVGGWGSVAGVSPSLCGGMLCRSCPEVVVVARDSAGRVC